MKAIVSVLAESPFYFTMTLQDRYGLVKRLRGREQQIDLSHYQEKISLFLKATEAITLPFRSVDFGQSEGG
jgi:hypothetical protein